MALQSSSQNGELLTDFASYCQCHPEERFWQALRNWSGHNYICAGVVPANLKDTFYWKDKGKKSKNAPEFVPMP